MCQSLDYSWPIRQAGLSIGFGALTEEYAGGLVVRNSSAAANCILNADDAFSSPHVQFSKLVTIVNVLLGSGVIGGALSYFLEKVVDSQEAWCVLSSSHVLDAASSPRTINPRQTRERSMLPHLRCSRSSDAELRRHLTATSAPSAVWDINVFLRRAIHSHPYCSSKPHK